MLVKVPRNLSISSLDDGANGTMISSRECSALDFKPRPIQDSEYATTISTKIDQKDEPMYEVAMSVFCDLENGKAFQIDYEWPLTW